MNVPFNSKDMAYCQPSGALRDRLLTDLNIRGLNACPDKVDISAIRLVYDFADHTIENYRTVQAAITTPIAGLITVPVNIYQCNALPGIVNAQGISYEKLIYVFCQVILDAAGRALLAVTPDEIRFHLRFLDAVSGIYVEIGNAAWTITPSVGFGWNGVAGTHIVSLGAAASAFPAPNLFTLVLTCPLQLRHTAGGYLLLEAECTNVAGFPVNSTITVNAAYSFK